MATIAEHESPTGRDSALGNKQAFRVVFNERGRGVAYYAEIGSAYHLVHNGKAGPQITAIDKIAVSPDGRRIAYSAMVNSKWRMVIDGSEGVDSDEVSDPVFSPDSRHIAYEAKMDGKWHIVVDDRINEERRSYGTPVFSNDSNKIAYNERVGDKGEVSMIVSDLAFKTQDIRESTGILIAVNNDNSRIAAINKIGEKQRVVGFSFDRPDDVSEGPLYDAISNLVFGVDGVSIAYVAERAGKRFLILNGREERLPNGDMMGPPVVRPDNKGEGVIISSQDGYFLHQSFFDDGTKKKLYDEAEGLVYSGDGSRHAYAARKGDRWFIVVNGKEGPAFNRVVAPVFSPDSRWLVYRVRDEGKRFVVVADADGRVIKRHSDYEMVFQPVFTDDGKSVAYGVKDGKELWWKVEKL